MVIWPSLFIFFTTLDGCWLFLIVIWTSLFVFFYNFGWVLFIPDCHLAITVYLLGEHSAARFRTQ